MISRYCFIVPNYNHGPSIECVLVALQKFLLPIILVDDGSDSGTRQLLIKLSRRYSHVTLVHHQKNQGKGAAVQTGLEEAHRQGFSHALQIDADGQHCLDDIHSMLELSRQYPMALVSGKPLFDESIPKHRFISRYITHFWVCVETLSTRLRDTMCGFRVYPVPTCVALFRSTQLGKRMDFDIEVMVRLYWRGVPVIFKPTKVVYPEGNASHFKLFKDNILISWMHTRLCFGMLPRLPWLVWRNVRRLS